MQEQYHIRQNDGGVQGGFPISKVRAWIEQGRVRRDMQFTTDGGATWRGGHECPELFGPSSAPPGPPPLPPATGASRGRVRVGSRRRTPAARQEPRRRSKKNWLLIGVGVFLLLGVIGQMTEPKNRNNSGGGASSAPKSEAIDFPVVNYRGERIAVIEYKMDYYQGGGVTDLAHIMIQLRAFDYSLRAQVRDAKGMTFVRENPSGYVCFQWLAKPRPDRWGKEQAYVPNCWVIMSNKTIRRIHDVRSVSNAALSGHTEAYGLGGWR